MSHRSTPRACCHGTTTCTACCPGAATRTRSSQQTRPLRARPPLPSCHLRSLPTTCGCPRSCCSRRRCVLASHPHLQACTSCSTCTAALPSRSAPWSSASLGRLLHHCLSHASSQCFKGQCITAKHSRNCLYALCSTLISLPPAPAAPLPLAGGHGEGLLQALDSQVAQRAGPGERHPGGGGSPQQGSSLPALPL
jgi:hypothetical protein